jgi:hypothetical protein
MVNNEIVNSAGTSDGRTLKYAMKLPNLLTVRFAAGSSMNTSHNAAGGSISRSEVVEAYLYHTITFLY